MRMVSRLLLVGAALCSIGMLSSSTVISAQQPGGGSLGYGETVSGILAPDAPAHTWTFPGAQYEIVQVTAQRISGQFSPRIGVFGPDGALLASTDEQIDLTGHTLFFYDSLPADGTYTIQVQGENVRGDVDNPDEYSLTLLNVGMRRADPFTGLAIPDLSTDGRLPPPLESGTPESASDDRAALGVSIFGQATVQRPDPGMRPADFTLTGSYTIDTLKNGNVISRLIRSISFLDQGIGLTSAQGVPFFTDQNITQLENDFSSLTVTLANGQRIVTDFWQVESIQAAEGLVAVRLVTGQRLVLSGQQFDLRQADKNYRITLDNGQFIESDLEGWHTLAALPGAGGVQVSVLYERDFRVFSDVARLILLRRDPPADTPLDAVLPVVYDLTVQDDDSPLVLEIDDYGMGDISIASGALSIRPLDGRSVDEPLPNAAQVLVEDTAVRVRRVDGSYRLSLRDRTEIETPAAIDANPAALPHESGYTPYGHNNLGADLLPTSPGVNQTQEAQPVNPVNGNFYYPVQDFYTPSHTLALDFTRYYNSQDAGLTPAYMLRSPAATLFAGLGRGWRHTYQIDLDITYAPLGQVTLILPDGARHIFTATADSRYRSKTLAMWTVEVTDGVTGSWLATRTDGLQYVFDRAGRLQRIVDSWGLALTFSPMPRGYLEGGDVRGFLAVEPYGRRLEVYVDGAGQITRVRNAEKQEVAYTYTPDGALSSADYRAEQQTARYDYVNGLLAAITDPRSPYHPAMQVVYDVRGRVQNYSENPAGPSREFAYAYEEQATSQTTTVSGEPRVTRWTFSPARLITRIDLPQTAADPEWHSEYACYDEETAPFVNEFRQPGGNRILFEYNDQGHLTRLRDPIYTETEQVVFKYTPLADGRRLQLDEITYGTSGYDRFAYDADYHLISRARLVQTPSGGTAGVEQVTRYEYDAWGRVAAIYTPGPDGAEIVSTYAYDKFGYVSQVSEGNGLRALGFVHDRGGRLRSITDGRGYTTAINWDDARDLITTITDPLGGEVAYTYDEWGNLLSQDDHGALTQVVYNGLGQPVSVTDPLGQVTSYTADEAGNILQVILPDGASTYRYRYDAGDNLLSAETPDGMITTYGVRFEKGEGGTPTGRLIRSWTDPAGNTTDCMYDALGRIREIVLRDRSGSQTYYYTLQYKAAGTLIEMQRASGAAGFLNSLEYNLMGQPVKTTVGGQQTSYTYNAAGWLASVTTPGSRTTTYAYDALGRITSVTLPGDGITPLPVYTYTYDENGNMVSAADPLGNTTSYTYDRLNRLETVIDPLGNLTTYHYDARGNLTGITDPRGSTRQATYNDASQLTAITDRMDNTTTYDYSDLGRLLKITDPRGLFYTEYTYDPNGNVVALSFPDERKTLFNYDVLGRVTSVTDALGHTTIYTYNQLDRISSMIDPVGNLRRYQWASDGRLRYFIAPSGNRYEYAYDGIGRLTQITDLNDQYNGINTYIAYDDAGHITDIQFANSQTRGTNVDIHYQYTYTPQGRLETYTDPVGNQWRFTYDAAGHMTRADNPNGIGATYGYDAAGRITQVTQAVDTPQARTELFEYDSSGNVTRYTAPDGLVSEFVYDANNRLKQRVDGVGTGAERQTLYEYNELGRLISVQDPQGRVTEYAYNEFGSLTSITRTLEGPSGERTAVITRYLYDKAGNLVGLVLPEGAAGFEAQTPPEDDYRINMTYNALDLRVRYIDAEDKVWTYTYDLDGHLVQVSDPLGSVVEYEYDPLNRITRVIYPNGAVVNFSYDGAGNLNNVAGADTEVRTGQGQQETVGFEHTTITYTIDRVGNLTAIQDIDTSKTTFTYDKMGHVLTRTDPEGRTTTYSYDALGQLTAISSPDGTTTRQYDVAGRLTAVSGPQGTYEFAYDAFGQVVRASSPWLTVSRTYDQTGHILTRDAGPFGTIQYTYDSLYRLVRVDYQGEYVEFAYDKNGWTRSITRSNGVTTSYEYDTNGRPTRVTHLGPTGILDLWAYAYDDAGNITRINRFDQWSILYSYDTAHQVINERWLDPNTQTRYALTLRYDKAGNRVEALVSPDGYNPSRTIYIYDRENQLIEEVRNYTEPALTFAPPAMAGLLGAAGLWALTRPRRRRGAAVLAILVGVALLAGIVGPVRAQQDTAETRIKYEYDRAGNLTRIVYPAENGGALQFRYDAENRLTAITGVTETGLTLNTSLSYNPFNQLAGWSSTDSNVRFYYDGETLLGMEDLSTGAKTLVLEPVPGQRLLTIRPDGARLWALGDALGSVRRVVDGNGALVSAAGFDYNAFGEQIAPYGAERAAPADVWPAPQFAGQPYDPTTGLYVMGLRAYDPRLGRFIQRDPVRHDPRGTLYTYAYNRPGMYVDPLGTTPQMAIDAAGTINVPGQIKPAVIPSPLLPDIVYPPTVSGLQADEAFRALRVSLATHQDLNEVRAMLDPLLRDFYVYRAHPIPDSARRLSLTLPGMMQPYTPGPGWSALAQPEPGNGAGPLAVLRSVEPVLLQAQAQPLAWYADSAAAVLPLPDGAPPQPVPAQSGYESVLLGIANETPLMSSIAPEIATLTPTPDLRLVAAPQPGVSVPQAAINLDVLSQIEALRARQRRFYADALFVGGGIP